MGKEWARTPSNVLAVATGAVKKFLDLKISPRTAKDSSVKVVKSQEKRE